MHQNNTSNASMSLGWKFYRWVQKLHDPKEPYTDFNPTTSYFLFDAPATEVHFANALEQYSRCFQKKS